MFKISEKEFTRFAAILGLFLATLALLPEAGRAQIAHEGKFSAPANGKTRIYTNATSLTQTVLLTVCVNTTGPQILAIDSVTNGGVLVDTLTSVKLGQCKSVTAELASDHNVSVGASVSAAGSYTVSILP